MDLNFQLLLIVKLLEISFLVKSQDDGNNPSIFVSKCLQKLPHRSSLYVPYLVLSFCSSRAGKNQNSHKKFNLKIDIIHFNFVLILLMQTTHFWNK